MFWSSSNNSNKTTTALSLVPSGTSPISKVTPEDFTWVCSGAGSETHTIYFRLTDGTFAFAQFAWAKVSISTTFQTNVLIASPGKPIVFETLSNSKMSIGQDKISVVSEYIQFIFDPEMKGATVIYNNNNKKDPITMTITSKFEAAGYKIGDGYNDIAGGTAMHAFYPRVKVEATLCGKGSTVDGTGTGIFIRAASSKILPFNIGSRWYLSLTDSPDFYFHVLHYITPEKYGGENISQAALIRNDKPAVYFYDNVVEIDKLDDSLNSKYHVPRQIRYTLKGRTEDGKAATLQYTAELTDFVYEVDVLGQLNRVLKSFVQAIVTSPYIFDFMENNATLKLCIDGEPEQTMNGKSFHELSFMD
ncbi:hypothetical protein BB561_000666 [Smittium simulii]|uniref:Svf1-like C-terminal domain-containing protein n=1 Tax=Smittium simulii TaxID=133385 RepID=A0A2T9YY27_9FUNG|nr:hypothetical protein BB561_000666 [Smittium simulii]